MSYATIFACANDQDFVGRLTSCCAQENRQPDPFTAASAIRWQVASKSDIEAAYASALTAGIERPGLEPSVITDAMILSAVQSIPEEPSP